MISNGDLTRSVESGDYKRESSGRLRELLTGALNIGGSNPIALHRINHAAEIIKKELEARDAAQREKMKMSGTVKLKLGSLRLSRRQSDHVPSIRRWDFGSRSSLLPSLCSHFCGTIGTSQRPTSLAPAV